MSFPVSIEEEYIIRRINNWYINISQNKIYGETQVFGLNFDTRVSGPIVAWVDNHVMAKIDCKLYAFVLGNIEITKKPKRSIYYDYLKTKIPKPSIVI